MAKIESARGFASIQTATLASVTNTTTETTLYSETIVGGSMGTNKALNFELSCQLTTGLTPPTLTVKIYLGTSVVTVTTGLALGSSLTTKPFIISGRIVNRDSQSSQYIYAKIEQYGNNVPIILATASAMVDSAWSEDTSVDKLFKITSTYGTALAGTTLLPQLALVNLT